MKKVKIEHALHQRWAEFRFGVVGALLANPPGKQELRSRLKDLSDTAWTHPISGEKFRSSFPTIERWYYKSLNQNKDPVGILRRKLRCDSGTTRHLTPEMKTWLQNNYREHPSWSGQLHCDNLQAWLLTNPSSGMAPSYATVLRYMRVTGRERKARVRSPFAPAQFLLQAESCFIVGHPRRVPVDYSQALPQSHTGNDSPCLTIRLCDQHRKLFDGELPVNNFLR